MKDIRKYLQEVDANPNHFLIEAFNKYIAKDDNQKLIIKENVRPCFFSGNLEKPGKVVTISLNPAYEPGKTETAQEGKSFSEWYKYCLFRFARYDADTEIHAVFKNLFKVIAPPEEWRNLNKRKFLQENLVNLDWCYYYSRNFPSFTIRDLPQNLQVEMKNDFDETLLLMIEIAAPRRIFVHGQAISDWVHRSTSDLVSALELKNSYGKKCRLFEGKLTDTTTHVYYLEHFINIVNRNSTLEKINRYIN